MSVPQVHENIVRDNYIKCHFDNFELLVDTKTGFFNATKLCKHKSKNYLHYVELEKNKSLDKLLTSTFGQISYDVCMRRNASELAETYCHPIMLLSVAIWCSDESYAQVVTIVNEFFNRTVQRRNQLCKLLKQDELVPQQIDYNPSCKTHNDKYATFDLVVDEFGWFNATKFFKGKINDLKQNIWC